MTEEIVGLHARGHRHERPEDLGQRPRDHALPPAARPRRRDEARQAPDRHHAARHRALLRGQGRAARHPRPGPARREDPAQEDLRRARAQAPDAAPVREGPGARPAHDDRGVPHARPPARAVHRRHTARIVWDSLDRGRLVVFEGAQGTLLDIDHGTYPFVTSSNPVAGRRASGAGVGPKDIDEVWGVAKAYATRVGAGPFPTELDDELGDRIRERGGEYGTTTGRPRRCGWLDLVALRYAARINGLTGLVITKLDVLTGIDPLRVWHQLPRRRGRHLRRVPLPPVDAAQGPRRVRGAAGLVDEDISECRTMDDLPRSARDYLDFVAELRGRAGRAGRRRPRARPGDLDRRARRRSRAVAPLAASPADSRERLEHRALVAPRRARLAAPQDPSPSQAAITDAVASVICTPSTPSSASSRRPRAPAAAPTRRTSGPSPTPSGIASVSRALGSLANSAALPAANASRIPGTKWWMWRRPIRTSNRSGTPLRIP